MAQQPVLDTMPFASSTALPQRSTVDVILDLKRTLHPTPAISFENRKPSGPSDLTDIEDVKQDMLAPLEENVTKTEKQASNKPKLSPEEVDYDGEDDDVDIADLPTSGPRKVTERKRTQMAVFDTFVREQALHPSEDDSKEVIADEEARQSTRWLVNQSENRVIISTPREYQVELFERAKEKNIIAVMDTGSGKTLIACLLLRHVFAQELEDRAMGIEHRISFFLVDSVQLVFQQHAVLKANLDQPMNMFCGEMGTKIWQKERWEAHFRENMVIVCTAEVLRHCLHRSFITIDRINLLIFDEAHHAKKDHPYARIIKDFYATEPKTSTLPKIFGMTASPVDAKVDPRKAAAELETILHCEIATAVDTSKPEKKKNGSAPEAIARYYPLRPKFETPLFTQMKSRLTSNSVLRKPLIFALQASSELGSWCSDQMWRFCLDAEEIKKLQAKTERKHLQNKAPPQRLREQQAELDEAYEIVKSHVFEAPEYNSGQHFSANMSSKVTTLVKYLRERFERPTDDKCIVFVKQRYTARILGMLLSQPNITTEHLRVGTLVGTRSGDAGDLNTSFREQVLTMQHFRKNTINCLIATSVAEEGLDVPDCNLIVRFDLYDTLIQYIQSRGRARHHYSTYIHMAEAGNREHDEIIKECRKSEAVLKNFCNALPEDRRLTGIELDMDHFLAKERTHRVYKTEAGAKLNYKIALSVLSTFVASIPQAGEERLHPEYVITSQNKMFIGEVILPEKAPIRGGIGRPATTKQVAKCSAAFETCLLLIQGKYLDKWLLSTYDKQLPSMRNALLAVDSKKQASYEMKTKPILWTADGVPEELFMTILNLSSPESMDRPSQPLALLTRSPLPELPSFYLHFGLGRHSLIHTVSLSTGMKPSPVILNLLNTFTLCIFEDVFSKEYESDISKMPYFLAPLKLIDNISKELDPSDLVSWDTLEDIHKRQFVWKEKGSEAKIWKTEADEFFEDKYITDIYDGSRKLWCKGVAPQYRPLDPVPANSAPRNKRSRRMRGDNILEYSSSLFTKSRARLSLDETQRVFEAEFIPLKRNLLDEQQDKPEERAPTKCFVCLELLHVSSLPTTVVAMAYCFPAIIHRVEACLIAMECARLLNLKIRPDLALEALTKDADNSGDHDAEKINFQRGMGNNYERLEFLGDSFLKMATTISLYGIYPENNEFAYHVGRMLLICNKNLCTNAVKLGLFKYIRSQQFNRRAWYPEGLKLLKGKQATAATSHNLGDKSIADVCEAFIGAALLSTDDMDNAVRAVTELVCSENHSVTKWSDYYKLYSKPLFQTKVATEMQKDMARQVEMKHAYHFKWPCLLRSAFVHPSYPYSYEHIPSYQRLEFLGDALLDMACINFLFHNHPGKDPQWLTEHKMAMVSNAFLGCLCVELGFHTHLLFFNTKYQKQIGEYVTEITEAKLQAQAEAKSTGKSCDDYAPDYWTSVQPPPKCLPDIVEAYVGAMFVDSEYDYSRVEDFFETHIKWYFKDMQIFDTYANNHPTTFLTNFLATNMGCMDWSVMTKEVPSIDGSKPRIGAGVLIHNKIVVYKTAESGRYAKLAAAKAALALLEGLPLAVFREQYGCACHPPDEAEAKAIQEADLHGTAI